mmetsp:Transcript_34668/g.68869  ORF Transcript_34668/g.68869 Transcript_34668/m.68869 type:complete len:90 (-) Transcript_34668:573-842(-)
MVNILRWESKIGEEGRSSSLVWGDGNARGEGKETNIEMENKKRQEQQVCSWKDMHDGGLPCYLAGCDGVYGVGVAKKVTLVEKELDRMA